MKPLRLGIIGNTSKPMVAKLLPEFLGWLNAEGISFIVAADLAPVLDLKPEEYKPAEALAGDVDFVLSFGGDGTFLQTAACIAPRETPIIGVNLGGLGYLADVGVEDLRLKIHQLQCGEYRVQERAMLEGLIASKKDRFVGLNDIVIEKGGFPRTIRLDCLIDGQFLNTFHADGLIVSTPTGSTGYSLSVGGPILDPDVDVLVLNPISPHMLANRPLVINGSRRVDITAFAESGEFQITADGQKIARSKSGTKVTIRRADFKTKIVLFGDYSFHAVLRNKLHWRDQFSESGESIEAGSCR